MNKRVVIVDGSRTPIGTYGKAYKDVPVTELLQSNYRAILRRISSRSGHTDLQIAGMLDGIYLGWGYQNSFYPNLARFAWLKEKLPANVPAMTLQRQCGSGGEALAQAWAQIKLGKGTMYLAGGVESMSTVPYILDGRARYRFPATMPSWVPRKLRLPKFAPLPIAFMVQDGLAPLSLIWSMEDIYMAGTAQMLADLYEISRQEADEFSLRSQELALKARESGRLAREIDPFYIQSKGRLIDSDEHPRSTSLEALAQLRPVLKTRQITAGNASGMNDGSCLVLVMELDAALSLGFEPLVELVDYQVTAGDPRQMGIGPVSATGKLLAANNLSVADIGRWEANEAFACQLLAVKKLLSIPEGRLNLNGGAISLGHPIAATMARLPFSLGIDMSDLGIDWGVATACVGGGMAVSWLLKAVQ